MADAFQKFKNSVNRGITTLSVKTSSSLEKSKLKTHIDSVEKDVQKLIFDIGQDAYAIWCTGGDYGQLAEKCALVQQKKEEIEKLTGELNAIDDRDNQILGKNQEASQPAAQPQAPQPAPGTIFCPSCGTQYDEPVKFCRKCGCNLQAGQG